eukprot:4370744-Alexandrium_andersonii.AAC.1
MTRGQRRPCPTRPPPPCWPSRLRRQALWRRWRDAWWRRSRRGPPTHKEVDCDQDEAAEEAAG